MKIYAVRHGQTELNVKGLINGSIPDSLTDQGKEQARQVVAQLPKTITHIYSSPLTRARQTAEIINQQLQVPLTFHEALQEVNFGELEGTPFLEKYQERHTQLDYDWRPSGECFEDVKKRVVEFLTDLKLQEGDGQALLVVHGGIIRMLSFLETGSKHGEIANAGLFEFDLQKIVQGIV